MDGERRERRGGCCEGELAGDRGEGRQERMRRYAEMEGERIVPEDAAEIRVRGWKYGDQGAGDDAGEDESEEMTSEKKGDDAEEMRMRR